MPFPDFFIPDKFTPDTGTTSMPGILKFKGTCSLLPVVPHINPSKAPWPSPGTFPSPAGGPPWLGKLSPPLLKQRWQAWGWVRKGKTILLLPFCLFSFRYNLAWRESVEWGLDPEQGSESGGMDFFCSGVTTHWVICRDKPGWCQTQVPNELWCLLLDLHLTAAFELTKITDPSALTDKFKKKWCNHCL